uniref:Uncharacterized protein n=1 Tax=Sphaeramia orbicularis TaxID=375764 RepID=A0A673AQT3_9TELE
MAEAGAHLNPEMSSCLICLDPLVDPVTVPCGHVYCTSCIHTHWDGEDDNKTYSCPQCRQIFTERPVQKKNITFADLMEELKKTGHRTGSGDHIYSEVLDVTCDMCTETRRRAAKSCLQCLVSYCSSHLQPHYDVPQFKRHELIEPTRRLQENICPHHGELMRMFCRTDQQCICYHCPVDEHKGHDTVSAVAERDERQKELEVGQRRIKAWIQEKEKDLKVLQQEVEVTCRSADKTDEYSEEIFTVLMRLVEKRRCNVKELIRSRKETQVNRVKDLQRKLMQEISELRREDAELLKLLLVEDHNQFLQSCASQPNIRKPSHSSGVSLLPLCYFEDVTAAVSELTLQKRGINTGKKSKSYQMCFSHF